jgi:hypothetical protein
LATKRAGLVERINKTTLALQQAAFVAYALGDKEAKTRTDELAATLAALDFELTCVASAKIEAERRKATAVQADQRTADKERAKRIDKLLDELASLGEPLDAHVGTPRGNTAAPQADADRFRFLRNPAAQEKAAALIGATLTELRGLKLDNGATFPNRLWDVAGRDDLKKALTETVLTGWQHKMNRWPRSEWDSFTGLLRCWAQVVRTDLQQHEQTTEKAA